MKSTQEILANRDARQEAALTYANDMVASLVDTVISETTDDVVEVDSPEFRSFANGSATTALRLAYLTHELSGNSPFFDLMSPDQRFEVAVRELTEVKALSEDLAEVIVEIAVGAGVLPAIVRHADGLVDYEATIFDVLGEKNPTEVAELILAKVAAPVPA